jgi:hypothetical protein
MSDARKVVTQQDIIDSNTMAIKVRAAPGVL